MAKPTTDEVMEAIGRGDEFKIQTEDATIINFKTGETRVLCGVRVYLRTTKGGWAKTAMWLVANVDAGRPNTNGEALASLVRALQGMGVVEPDPEVVAA